jgi:NADH:ubiquinone oxidoreductase subunit K
MILTLFIISALLFLFGIYSFWKKKGVIGVFAVLVGLLGFALGIAVVYFYPDKLGF